MNSNSYKKFPLCNLYKKKALALKGIKICIVGRDPYPSAAMNLPFCKNQFDIKRDNCSGKHLLRGLGVDVHSPKYSSLEPYDIFMDLLDQGIAVLNSSYYYLEKETLSKRKHMEFFNEAYTETNKELFKKSDIIILLGESSKMVEWLNIKDGAERKMVTVCHPDVRNRYNSAVKESWNKTFNKLGGLIEAAETNALIKLI